MREQLSGQGAQAVQLAEEQARRMGHEYLGTEHLLLGLLDQTQSPASRVLRSLGVDPLHVRSEIERTIGPGERVVRGRIPLTPLAERAMRRTMEEAEASGMDEAGGEQLLLGLAEEQGGLAARILLALDISTEHIRDELARLPGGAP